MSGESVRVQIRSSAGFAQGPEPALRSTWRLRPEHEPNPATVPLVRVVDVLTERKSNDPSYRYRVIVVAPLGVSTGEGEVDIPIGRFLLLYEPEPGPDVLAWREALEP